MESVHDYPRPPAVELCDRHVRVELDGSVVAHSDRALRVLETTHPPVIYIPRDDVEAEFLRPAADDRRTFCEWKGEAAYYDLVVGDRVSQRAAWHYPDPAPGYRSLLDHIALYPGKVTACFLNGEQVTPQPGGFYGGWITSDVEV